MNIRQYYLQNIYKWLVLTYNLRYKTFIAKTFVAKNYAL